MQKIDRLGWAAGLCFTSYGLRIGIRVNQPEVLEQLTEYLPPGWKPSAARVVDRLYSLKIGGSVRPGIRNFHLLYTGPSRLARTMVLEGILEALDFDLQLYVAERARRRVFIHAGVVGWRERAIVIPGMSHAGKTTLVAALVRAGATYYSDEYAVFDAQGRVHPYARPLGIRDASGDRPRRCPVRELGGTPGSKPLAVGLVAVSEYREGGRWRPRALSPGQGALALLENTVSARRRPRAALEVLQQVVSQAPVLKGPRGEAEEAARDMLCRAMG